MKALLRGLAEIYNPATNSRTGLCQACAYLRQLTVLLELTFGGCEVLNNSDELLPLLLQLIFLITTIADGAPQLC